MSKPRKIRIPATTYTEPPPDQISDEDVRWAKIVLRSVDGLASFAEARAEGDDAWMGMQLMLEELAKTVKSIVEDFEERMKGGAE